MWKGATHNGRRVAVAIVQLQQANEDTSAQWIAGRIGATDSYSVAAQMACLKKVTDPLDASPTEPQLLTSCDGDDGRVRYRFAPEACALILRHDDRAS